MSTLFQDTEIEVIKLVIQKRDGSGSSTYYIAQDFWWSGAIYTSSPVVYPLLVDSPAAKRSCGTTMAVRHNVNINIYAHAPLSSVNNTFADLLSTHDFHNAAVQIRYYVKSHDGTTTDSDSVNLRQTLNVVDVNYNQDDNLIQLTCRDSWFDDKDFAKRFLDADFSTGVTNYQNQWVGEVAPWAFGDSEDGSTGVIVSSCPLYKSELVADGGGNTYQRIYITTAVSDSDTGFSRGQIYVNNPFKDLDYRSWLPLSTFNSTYGFRAPLKGPTSWAAGVDQNMYQWRLATKYAPGTTARLIGGCSARLKRVGTIAAGTGQLMVTVREAVQVSGSNYAAVGSILAQAVGDAVNLSTSYADVNFFFPVPLVLPPNHSYFFILEWTNSTDTSNYVVAKYDTLVTTNPVYTNDQTVNKDGWTETAAELQLQIWDFGAESTVTGTTVGDHLVYTQRLDNLMSGTNPYTFDGVQFKIGLETTAGTPYNASTGTLTNPAALVHYVLRNDVLGLNVSTSAADYDEIDDVRDLIGSNLELAGTVEEEISCGEFIRKICEQSRLRFYKKRTGKVSLNFPTPMTGSYDADISEGVYRGDMICLSIEESPESELINKVDAVYNPDVLNLNQDLALGRRVKDSRYTDTEYIYDGASGTSDTDTAREDIATASKALYGERYSLLRFDYHNQPAHAKKAMNYLFDRYSYERRIQPVRVLRKTWHNTIDMFSKVRVSHRLIPTTVGSRMESPGKTHDGSGTAVTIYNEGVPTTVYGQGEIVGEVLEISEQGPYMVLQVETVNSFEAYV